MSNLPSSTRWSAALVLAVLFGCGLNALTFNAHLKWGYDEALYVRYAEALSTHGLSSYPAIVREYTALMRAGAPLCLPPLRIGYIGPAMLAHAATGISFYSSFSILSCAASMASLIWCALICRRFLPAYQAAGVTFLMACAPLRLHLGSRAFIDAPYTFWTWMILGALLLALREPEKRTWPILYCVSWFLLVLTRESALLIWVAVALLIVFHIFTDSKPSRAIIWATLLGPLAATLLLLFLAGGMTSFMDAYAAFFFRALIWPQALLTGDGPWYRYAIDWILLCPVPFLLAACGSTQVRARDSLVVTATLFWALTFIMFSCLRYGYNLRYTAVWDIPIRILAVAAIAFFASRFPPRWRSLCFLMAILAVGSCDLAQYQDYFVKHSLYDPIPIDMLRIKKVLKYGSDLDS